MKQNDAAFYTCCLIEQIGRITKQPRGRIVEALGADLNRIYSHADVFHCEPLQKTAWDFIEKDGIPDGNTDVEAAAKYSIPDVWEIGEVFARLVEDCFPETDALRGIRAVFCSWMCPEILNFNSDLYYQPRDYLAECFREGRIIAA